MNATTAPTSTHEQQLEPRPATGRQLWRLNALGLLALRTNPGAPVTITEAFALIAAEKGDSR